MNEWAITVQIVGLSNWEAAQAKTRKAAQRRRAKERQLL